MAVSIMTGFIRHFLVYQVAALVVYTSWAFAGTRVAWLWPIFWLTLGVIEAMVFLPVVRTGETLDDARGRVARAVVFDPLLYVGAAFLLLLAFQGFNGPRAPFRLPDGQGWGFGAPPWRGFPSGVLPSESAQLLAWFPPALVAVLALRHALDADGRRLLLRIMIWNAATLALIGFVQMACGAKAIFGVIPIDAQFFSSFGYPNHAGAFFTFMLVVAGGFWLYQREAEVPGADRLLIAVAILYGAAVLCLSRTSIIMATVAMLAGGSCVIMRIWPRLAAGSRIMTSLLSVVLPLFGYLGLFVVWPGNPVRREMTGLTIVSAFNEVYERAFELLVPAAITIWRDNPVYGVGGWGFRHFVPLVLSAEQHRTLFVGAANVHNDVVNFLVEHGVVGVILLAVVGVMLLKPLFRRVPFHRNRHGIPAGGSTGLFRGFVLCALGLVLCHSLIDLPFRCPAVIQAVLITLALVGGMCREAEEKS